MRRSAGASAGNHAPIVSLSGADEPFQRDLVKLRLVLILGAAPRGSKIEIARAAVAKLRGQCQRISVRSVYRWQARYESDGFAGLLRRTRRDHARVRRADLLSIVIYCAIRVRQRGDIQAEYNRLKPAISYSTFRTWVRRIQAYLRGQGDGIF